MAKIKNRILIVLALVMLCAVGVFALAACNNTETYTVTFMVRENGTTGDWQQYTTVDTNDDGSVTLPAEPTVDGYTFRDWYTDEACSADNVFDETSVSGDITVYALMAEANITLNVTDGSGTTAQIAGTLSALSQTTAEQEAAAAEENLTFDGWYTDAAFTQKYSDGMDATALYGRYMAQITYYNGYEYLNDFTINVSVNGTTTAPSAEDIATYYMDSATVSYAYSSGEKEGEDFDFSAPITENTVIRVMWATPGAVYDQMSNGTWYFKEFDRQGGTMTSVYTYPCLSFLSEVTYENQEIRVEAVSYQHLYAHTGTYKILFADGIKMIRGFYGTTTCSVQEIELPSTLKILDGAFWFLPDLQGIELPDGLEVIIDSFWANYLDGLTITGINYDRSGYDFEIAVPDSVINLSMVPTNLTFSENSAFYKENDRIYKEDEQGNVILIADYHVDDNGTLEVDAGVDGIQVGTFALLDELLGLRTIVLPSTWSFVSYNEDVKNYPYYYYRYARGEHHLSIAEKMTNPSNYMATTAYSIADNLDSLDAVVIEAQSMPSDINRWALSGVSSYQKPWSMGFKDKVYFIGKVEDGASISVTVRATYDLDGTQITGTVKDITSGMKLTRDQIIQSVNIDETSYEVLSITMLGEEYDFNEPKYCNQYIDVEYTTTKTGFTYKQTADGIVVTGFDQNTALYNGDSGRYTVVIPDTLDGISIVAIEDSAFENNQMIEAIYIGKNVKEIGAKAFKDTSYLTLVSITPGGLQIIGESAFEDSGFTEIALPLANLTYIAPYAFRSAALQQFLAVEGEDDRYVYSYSGIMEGLEEGGYYFVHDRSNTKYAIVRYKSVSEVDFPIAEGSEETMVNYVCDVQLVAVAGGKRRTSYGPTFHVGNSLKNAYGADNVVLRYEVMEGSVYYLNNLDGIAFGIISKIHANAFTCMDEKFTTLTTESDGTQTANIFVYKYDNAKGVYDTWITLEEVQSIDPDIFEEGWWEGYASDSDEYNAIEKAMQLAEYGSSSEVFA